MVQAEEIEQTTLFRWAEFAEAKYPELGLMYHIPNEGKRSAVTGARLKAQGLKSGVPDVCLPTAHGGYIGLYIEMKVRPNKPTENQKQWLRALRGAGHFTAVAYTWEEAKDLIEEYLRLPLTIPKGENK
ncbi:VRR-NUC domain-containing protein [uncultured Ruminococcus sp.]|uniref:VRR-NUC domain-containing protein n=1 Tax=uncultured Ruminococcus sp. TaxID=165186 RepID=UPI0025FB2700|nr:VRR-NUC domain-containing protein [uncultured Ruminococcus sp.]